MRIVAFASGGDRSWGIVDEGKVLDLGSATGTATLGEVLRSGRLERALEASDDAPELELTDVQLDPPVVDPHKILCVGLNYADHIKEMGRPFPERPVVFTRYPDTMVGSGQPMVAPRNSSRFDYEGEFSIVIGKRGRHIAAQDALDHVLGYTLMNDGSLRDYQRHTPQFTPGKNFPRSGSLGPWIVTADEFGVVGSQRIATTLNGVTVQESRLDQLVFGVADLIAYLTEWTELEPGDVIATGTPGGVGDGRSPALYMSPGDVVSVEVEGIGTLTNSIVSET
ncbi:fumarylacetoacetate hydrolase family protein [Microbacterium sp. A196]|uniref:fumarylacetoacetate hydrolase family protein n=1 Tax=Microbacterium sp. A196 TaxID=3457320 RepID=UPI003FD58B0A